MSVQQQQHLRSDSSDTSSSGASYQLVLDHVLSRPVNYELPLRTMYTLNCAPRGGQPVSLRGQTPASSNASSPVSSQDGWHSKQATQIFTDNLMSQIQQLPAQPASLPPSFITTFVQRCFPPELVYVDFPQALTGLDYLKDLETRRRRQTADAMARLGIDMRTLASDRDTLSSQRPGLLDWLISFEKKNHRAELLYSQLYVSLRRWILVNELSLLPFNKHNCIGMLNTLFPPVIPAPPTSRITSEKLKQLRDGYFKYIGAVEKNGTPVLKRLLEQGKGPNDENGWIEVTRILGRYLQVTNGMIDECASIGEGEEDSILGTTTTTSRSSGKADSGISFGASEPLPSRQGSVTEPMNFMDLQRSKTPIGARPGTALEKLARGLKHIGRSRTEATEMVPILPAPKRSPSQTDSKSRAESRNKSIRKVRSFATIEGKTRSKNGSPPSYDAGEAAFDADEMKRQRMRFENLNKTAQSRSHEV